MQINCRSLYKKVDEVKFLLETMQPLILAVTETWLTYLQAESILIPGYCFVHKPRLTGPEGSGLFHKMWNPL